MCEANAEHTAKPPRALRPRCFCGQSPLARGPTARRRGPCARGVATAAVDTRGGDAARARRIRRRVNRQPRRCWGHGRHGVADGDWVNRRGWRGGVGGSRWGARPSPRRHRPRAAKRQGGRGNCRRGRFFNGRAYRLSLRGLFRESGKASRQRAEERHLYMA